MRNISKERQKVSRDHLVDRICLGQFSYTDDISFSSVFGYW